MYLPKSIVERESIGFDVALESVAGKLEENPSAKQIIRGSIYD